MPPGVSVLTEDVQALIKQPGANQRICHSSVMDIVQRLMCGRCIGQSGTLPNILLNQHQKTTPFGLSSRKEEV